MKLKIKFVLSAIVFNLLGIGYCQTYNISSTGSGHFLNLTTALNTALTTETVGPVEFVFTDPGPFWEGRMIINESKGPAQVTIRTSNDSYRAKLIIANAGTADGALYIRKWGEPLTIKNLVIIPATTSTQQLQAAVKTDNVTVGEVAGTVIPSDTKTSITLQNILVSGNDGADNPVASLDGRAVPNFGSGYTTFRDEGFEIAGGNVLQQRNIYLYNCVASGLNGNQISNGLRALGVGAPGSEIVIGPGCAFTYNNLLNTLSDPPPDDSGLQSGNNGMKAIRIEGTQANPVVVANNNYNGVFQTGTAAGFTSIKWLISANNAGSGFKSRVQAVSKYFENVTIVNNGYYAWTGGDSVDQVYSSEDFATNVIIAGNNSQQQDRNLIEARTRAANTSGGGVFTLTDSAIVLSGPHSLNTTAYDGDGLDDETPSNVIRQRVINSNPQFASLDPASPGFVVVTNNDYGTAGPGGTPLVGGGRMATSAVADWQLF